MHRVKRSASSLADTAKSNPFHRFLQHRRRKGKKNNVSQSRETIVTPDSDHETNPTMTSPPENESSQAPTVHRTNTISIEEGRGTSSDDESYHPFTEKEEREHKTISGQIRAALFNSWINVLLIFAPAGIATHFAGVNPTVVFVLNFIAIIPLAALLSYGTEEIALYFGEVTGGLLNASFGNAVELIVSIIALTKHEIVIVQTSLIGSILSNLLLVLGMAFVAGGFNRVEQNFNTTVAQTASSLLALAVGSLIVPTAFHLASTAGDVGITELSRGTAIILLLVYGAYLFFQLRSHTSLYNEPSAKAPKRNKAVAPVETLVESSANTVHGVAMGKPKPTVEDEPETAELSLWAAAILLVASTVLVAICAECLVDSIDAVVTSAGISRVFVGLILLPIVGNAAEHATAVTVAVKDKMDLSIGVAVGSSMQIALLVIPFIVVLGWIMGIDEMTLYFDGFQVMILFIAILLVNYLIQDGKSNYLEGVLLVALYLIICLASWFYPVDGTLAQNIEGSE